MHIPDGYLSPETCAALYAASAPFWYVALRRVKRLLHSRSLPLVSLFAAFSFVVMMFNLPLPGGTTGHAVGMGIASIVIGPWASILAISSALVIQSLFFGDGGITAIGANCFNMAIAGSLAAWCVYRLLARGALLTSRLRVIAAGVAGYVAINIAAVLAALEFGLQPVFFHDAAGVPLYCPYPLSIALPAMLIGHLTFAGLAELTITAGVVAYLQRADPALLRQTAPDAPDRDNLPAPVPEALPARPVLRRLWLALAILLVLTPLGIVAVGSAWGEWSAQDFSNPETRREIAHASRNQPPPTQPPRGLARLANLWNAPFARYAPAFVRNPWFGYLASAAIGVGLLLLAFLLLPRLLPDSSRLRAGFVERSAHSLFELTERSFYAEAIARSHGLLQALDARAKLCGFFALILAAILIHSLSILFVLFLAATLASLWSRVPLRLLASAIWAPAIVFTGLIALPALFLTPGPALYRLPLLGWPITYGGIKTSALLLLRVETAVTLSSALILTTPWARLLRALRFFRLPAIAVMLLGMTHRYIFLLLKTAREMFEARRSRLVGELPAADRTRLASASVAVLLSKTLELASDVHAAMRSRGFSGEIYLLDEPAAATRDWYALAALLLLAAAFVFAGR